MDNENFENKEQEIQKKIKQLRKKRRKAVGKTFSGAGKFALAKLKKHSPKRNVQTKQLSTFALRENLISQRESVRAQQSHGNFSDSIFRASEENNTRASHGMNWNKFINENINSEALKLNFILQNIPQ